MADLKIIVTGREVEGAAGALSKVLTEGAGTATVSRIEPSALPEAARKIIDPFSIAAVVLAIPGAVLAVLDLVDRRRKRARAQTLIDTAKHLQRENGVQTSIVTFDGTPRLLEQLTADEHEPL